MPTIRFSIAITLFLLLCCSFGSLAQWHRSRPWKATVYLEREKIKGVFFDITDSSVLIARSLQEPAEYKFRDIRKIRLVPHFGTVTKGVVGLGAGAITGAVVLSTAATKGKDGEPRALSGVLGGIAGGILGGLVGFALAPGIYNFFATKRIVIQHNANFYQSLKLRLQRNAIRSH